MRKSASLIVVALLVPSLALAQQTPAPSGEEEWKSPPLVDSPKAQPPPGESASPLVPVDGPAPPPPEIGLMAMEGALGILTAAGMGLLLYYLALKPISQGAANIGVGPISPEVETILYLVVFLGVPLSVAQTEVRIANGSPYYASANWPASLAGLGAEGAVLGLYFLTRDTAVDRGEALLLIGTVAVVPLIQMAVINLTKVPRHTLPADANRMYSLVNVGSDGSVRLGVPMPRPTLLPGPRGVELGARISLLGGRF